MSRICLPNRRPAEHIRLKFRGLAYTACIGRFPNGSLAEIFLDCAKASSSLADDARDAAVTLSIALQHGTPAQAIREAVTREADGSATHDNDYRDRHWHEGRSGARLARSWTARLRRHACSGRRAQRPARRERAAARRARLSAARIPSAKNGAKDAARSGPNRRWPD
jgi:hypothetical protein